MRISLAHMRIVPNINKRKNTREILGHDDLYVAHRTVHFDVTQVESSIQWHVCGLVEVEYVKEAEECDYCTSIWNIPRHQHLHCIC